MKNRRGKVHPSSSSDALSVLNLLPTSFISLVALLSHEDLQVLAYMLTRSLKSTDPISPSNFPAGEDKKPPPCLDRNSPALFDCDCFRCYTSFWVRWDSSPNRDLIHQAIEAFEDHLSKGERGDKMGRRVIGSAAVESPEKRESVAPVAAEDPVSGGEGNELVAVGRGDERLARSALPDVMGIIGSRLWNLWSPKV